MRKKKIKNKKCKKILKAYEIREEKLKIVAEILEEIQTPPTEKSKENGRKLINFFDEIEGNREMKEIVNKTVNSDKLAEFIEKKYTEMCSKQPCGECKYAFKQYCKTLFIIESMIPSLESEEVTPFK